MLFGFLVLIIALIISGVAIYYSVSGLVAIFAAAVIPIIIMGSALEVGKLVAIVWLHKYWDRAAWWLRAYLSVATIVLMFITSMGIFGFLSKAHIEQTAAGIESVQQIERITTEIARQQAIINRAEEKIATAEASTGNQNTIIQGQIDTEQARIDSTYSRIQPAIDEQNRIIEAARTADENKVTPYLQQLDQLDIQITTLNQQAEEYENKLSNLKVDTSAVQLLLDQIKAIQDNVTLIKGQFASNETNQIKAAQQAIGVNDDGNAGPNTQRVANVWYIQQNDRIAELNSQIVTIRQNAQSTVDTERSRLTDIINDIRTNQIEAVKTRKLEVLARIDEVRNTQNPAIQSAYDEIARIRSGADAQIAASQELIQRLRDSLTVGADADVEITINEQQAKIKTANDLIDTLTEQKYTLEAENRKLEAEVGPVKYLAEFIYGNQTDKSTLEEAVRWVIIIIIFVFDPLAVVLLIASQYTFEWRKERKNEKTNRTVESAPEIKTAQAESKVEETTVTKVKDSIEEMLEKADPETIEEVFNELKKEKVDTNTEEPYSSINDTVYDKVYGIDGKLVQQKQIKSIKIINKEE